MFALFVLRRSSFIVRHRWRKARRALLKALDQPERSLLWSPVALGCGIGLYFLLPDAPLWRTVVVVSLFGVFSFWFSRRYGRGFLGIAWVCLGFVVAFAHTLFMKHPVLQHRYGPGPLSGQVEALTRRGKRTYLTLGSVPIGQHLFKIRVLTYRKLERSHVLHRTVRMWGVVTPPRSLLIPGGYPFDRAAWFEGLGGFGYVFGAVVPSSQPSFSLSSGLERWRHHVGALIKEHMSPLTAGVARALVIGDRSEISPEVTRAFRRAGLAHLLAISGLHIGLFSALLFQLMWRLLSLCPFLALRFELKHAASMVALMGAGAYTLLAGSSVPTERAFIMVALALGGMMMGRRALSLRSVALAALLLLMLHPEYLLEARFQLSFAAATALIAFYESGKRRSFFVMLPLSSVIASVATAPFVINHFGQLSLYGVFSNFLALPLMSFIVMPALFFALILPQVGPLYTLADWGLRGVFVATHVSLWPLAVVHSPPFPLVSFLLLVVGGLWVCIWRGWVRGLGLLPFCVSIVLALRSPLPDLFVGHGAYAVRQKDGRIFFSKHNRVFTREVCRMYGGCRFSGSLRNPYPSRLVFDGRTCISGTVLVTVRRKVTCPSAQVLEPRRGYAVYVRQGVRIVPARSKTDRHPWVVLPSQGKKSR